MMNAERRIGSNGPAWRAAADIRARAEAKRVVYDGTAKPAHVVNHGPAVVKP